MWTLHGHDMSTNTMLWQGISSFLSSIILCSVRLALGGRKGLHDFARMT